MRGCYVKVECPKCGKICSKPNFWRHERWHENNPNVEGSKKYTVLEHEGLNCKYCGKLCKNRRSLAQHEIRCKKNLDSLTRFPQNGTCNIPLDKRGWGKGQTKYTDERRARNAAAIKKYYETNPNHFLGKTHSEETKARIRQKQLALNHAYNDRHLWSKKGYYNRVFFMSSWELAYYIFMTDRGHKVERCSKRYEYYENDSKHYYTPDFILDDSIIIEVKGRETPIDKIKYSAINNLKIVYYDEIKEMIYYVLKTYNVKKVIELYD